MIYSTYAKTPEDIERVFYKVTYKKGINGSRSRLYDILWELRQQIYEKGYNAEIYSNFDLYVINGGNAYNRLIDMT